MSTTIDRSARRAGSAPPVEASRGDRFVAVSALALAVTLVGVQVLAGHLIPPLAVFGLVYLVLGTALLRWRRRWLLALSLVIALLHVGGSYPFFVANLAHPETPGSFLLEATVLTVGLTLIVGAIGGLRGARPGSRRPIAYGAIGLASVAVLISLVAASSVDSEARQPGDIAVEAVHSTFPERVEVPEGGATLWVDNRDPFHHTFVIEGTEVHGALPGNAAVRIDVDLEPGTYRYLCDVPGHDDMFGELVVR
jgi:plastocyanin